MATLKEQAKCLQPFRMDMVISIKRSILLLLSLLSSIWRWQPTRWSKPFLTFGTQFISLLKYWICMTSEIQSQLTQWESSVLCLNLYVMQLQAIWILLLLTKTLLARQFPTPGLAVMQVQRRWFTTLNLLIQEFTRNLIMDQQQITLLTMERTLFHLLKYGKCQQIFQFIWYQVIKMILLIQMT